jgi:hypothetical protein
MHTITVMTNNNIILHACPLLVAVAMHLLGTHPHE